MDVKDRRLRYFYRYSSYKIGVLLNVRLDLC